MKIGILTLPLHYNYGGILQAYALQTVLQRMGHEVEVIDKDFSAHLPWYKKPISYFKRIVKKYLFHKNCCVFLEQKTNYERSLFCKNTSVFVHKYVNTRKIKTLKAYKAEQVGLGEICGMGYRKALEFLIKDYLISLHLDKEEEFRKAALGNCINKIDNYSIKELARRATWLGNDETHYIRKWEYRDIHDLKNLIDLTCQYITMESKSKAYLEEMPEKI